MQIYQEGTLVWVTGSDSVLTKISCWSQIWIFSRVKREMNRWFKLQRGWRSTPSKLSRDRGCWIHSSVLCLRFVSSSSCSNCSRKGGKWFIYSEQGTEGNSKNYLSFRQISYSSLVLRTPSACFCASSPAKSFRELLGLLRELKTQRKNLE